MSYTLFVEGKITETTGGDHHVFSNKIISFNANGAITQTGEENGITFGEPKNAPPLEINNIYVKVRLKEPYNGEFGFDWADVNPDTKDIEKIQGIDFANVEYFYKEGATKSDLGNIIKKITDETGAKTAIEKKYKFNTICKHIDFPYVLIKPQQEITLSAEIIACNGTFNQDEITITGDKFFEFTIVGGEKEGSTSKIKVSKAGKIDFKVKCLQEISDPKGKEYNFFHSSATNASIPIGGVILMENKVLKLKFRVIALVSSDNDPNAKAKALFKKFKDAGVKDYLNKNSLNQAGYEVEIENFAAMDASDVDDYLYAFDKVDWTKKEYFSKDPERLRYYTAKNKNGDLDTFSEVQDGQLGDYYEYETNANGEKIKKIKKENDLDYITVREYKKKLEVKRSMPYENGGIIILSDFEDSNAAVAAYSRIYPFGHYILFVTSTATESTSSYAHELGHMLGLEHSFCDASVLKRYEVIKDYINEIDKTKLTIDHEIKQNQISEKNKSPKPLKNQSKTTFPFKEGYKVIKDMLMQAIDHSNLYYRAKIESYNSAINDKTNYSSYKLGGIIVTKNQFKENCKAQKEKHEAYERSNIKARADLEKYSSNSLIDLKSPFFLLAEDTLKIYEDFYNHKLIKEWHNTIMNYLYFSEKSTLNMMDYGQTLSDGKDTVENNRLLNHQIIIMRKDYENYN